MRDYSEALKQKLAQRMLMPNGPSANKLSQDVGVNQPTLSRWLRETTTLEPVTKRRERSTLKNGSTEPKRPEDRTADEKLRLVLEGDHDCGRAITLSL